MPFPFCLLKDMRIDFGKTDISCNLSIEDGEDDSRGKRQRFPEYLGPADDEDLGLT